MMDRKQERKDVRRKEVREGEWLGREIGMNKGGGGMKNVRVDKRKGGWLERKERVLTWQSVNLERDISNLGLGQVTSMTKNTKPCHISSTMGLYKMREWRHCIYYYSDTNHM